MSFEKYQKWTSSTLLKWTMREWSDFMTNMLRHPEYSKEEKNKRINQMLVLVEIIHDNCMDKEGFAFKK